MAVRFAPGTRRLSRRRPGVAIRRPALAVTAGRRRPACWQVDGRAGSARRPDTGAARPGVRRPGTAVDQARGRRRGPRRSASDRPGRRGGGRAGVAPGTALPDAAAGGRGRCPTAPAPGGAAVRPAPVWPRAERVPGRRRPPGCGWPGSSTVRVEAGRRGDGRRAGPACRGRRTAGVAVRRSRAGTAARATAAPARSARRSTSDVDGISRCAVTPPPAVAVRRTCQPCRRASRPTTNRPSTSVGARSSRSRRVSRAFSSASRSGAMPMPWSTTASRAPAPDVSAATATRVCGGEKTVAFSISSASTRTRSPTTAGATDDAVPAPRTSTRV